MTAVFDAVFLFIVFYLCNHGASHIFLEMSIIFIIIYIASKAMSYSLLDPKANFHWK